MSYAWRRVQPNEARAQPDPAGFGARVVHRTASARSWATFFRSPPGERGVVPFHMPTGLADGLGLESVPGSSWIPAPLVSPDSSDGTLGSPAPYPCRAWPRRSRKANSLYRSRRPAGGAGVGMFQHLHLNIR